MSLSFLVPAFLAGLVALGVPILIHLTRRQTKQPLGFPSFMFVRRIPDRTVRKRRLHRWPLFLLRCAALALLVLAFARPFLQSGDAKTATLSRGAREVVVLLDRSYSMGYGDRWARAQRAAQNVVEDLGSNDRASVVLFDAKAEASGATTDRALLRSTIHDAKPGPHITRYAPALRQAQRILSASTLPRRELVLVSDFQRSGLTADGAEIAGVRLPAGTKITPVSVADAKWTNGSVASVDIHRTPSAGREKVSVTARLTGPASGSGASRRVMLEIDGREMETRSVSTQPAGSATVTYTVRNTGNVRLGGRESVTVAGPGGVLSRNLATSDLPEILPGGSLTRTATVTGFWPAFRMTADVAVTPADESDGPLANAKPALGHGVSAAVPWSQLALLLLVVGATVGGLRLRRRRRAAIRATVAAAVAKALADRDSTPVATSATALDVADVADASPV